LRYEHPANVSPRSSGDGCSRLSLARPSVIPLSLLKVLLNPQVTLFTDWDGRTVVNWLTPSHGL